MLTVADTVLLEQRRETADLRDLASLQHSYQEGHNHEATCGLCDIKDRELRELRATHKMVCDGYRDANTGRMTAAGILRTMALTAWRAKDRSTLTSLATAFFAARMGLNFDDATAKAVEQIVLADMRVSNLLFGETKDVGETWT